MAKKSSESKARVDWWLAEVSSYGYASKLVDGPHSSRAGVEQAAYLIRGLGLQGDRKFCCVRVEQTDVEPKRHDADKVVMEEVALLVAKTQVAKPKRGGRNRGKKGK